MALVIAQCPPWRTPTHSAARLPGASHTPRTPALGTGTLLFSWTPGQPVSRLSLLLSCGPVWRPPVVECWGSWGGPTAGRAGGRGQPSPCLCSCRPGDQGWGAGPPGGGPWASGRGAARCLQGRHTGRLLSQVGEPRDWSRLAPQLPAPRPTCSSGFLLPLLQEPRELAVTPQGSWLLPRKST